MIYNNIMIYIYILIVLLCIVLFFIYSYLNDNKKNILKENFNKNIRKIHISGFSGSGKNYLSNKIKNYMDTNHKNLKILYIDSDDIWDKNSYDILKNFDFNNIDEYEIGQKLNFLSNSKTTEYINNLISNNSSNYDIIIIFGHTYQISDNNTDNFELYYINENTDIIYKRLMKRNLSNFILHKDYIFNILDNDNINIIMKPFYIRFKIKNVAPFPCSYNEFYEVAEYFMENYKKQNYLILSQNEIFNKITNF
jgi:hypothetical protein